ncbi:MAG: ABC transporter permease [Candidatus Brocadiia bacterium]
MRVLRIAKEGLRALAANKLRTFFMMAGTVVGIAALTMIMAIGEGTERKVMKRIAKFGPRAMMLISGGGGNAPGPDITTTTLTLQDAEAVRENIDGLEVVSPAAMQRGMNLRRNGKTHQATLFGAEPSWHRAWEWYAARGEGITSGDVATMARVCVIGQTVKEELFGDEEAIGGRIYVNNVSLQVKGILESRGSTPMGGDFDNRLLVPRTTAMRRILNIDHLGYVRMVVSDADQLAEKSKEVKELIRRRHHIGPAEEDDFRIVTVDVIAQFARGTSTTLSILLVALAGLSLLVGGVVLMNILLISVAERKAEIGLRRALGASRDDIFTQFLTESLAVTLLGMAIGAGMGWAICLVLPKLTDMPAVLSWQPLALGVTFALIVGTVFGVQPARRAAKLNPVEALR